MPQPRNAFKLGLTMIVIFALLAGVLMFMSTGLVGATRTVIVRFPDGTSLPPLVRGSDVYFGSLVVGRVSDITLSEEPMSDPTASRPAGAPARRTRAFFEIAIAVDRDLELREDCKITVSSQLIGTTGTVVITERGTSPVRLGDGAKVAGVRPASLDQLTARLAEVSDLVANELNADNPSALLAKIKQQLDAANELSLIAKLHTSLDDFNQITASVAAQLDAAQRGTLLAKLHGVLDHVNAATAALRKELDAGADDVVIAKVHAALDSMNAGLTQAVGMLTEVRPPVRATLTSIEATARRLDEGISKPIAEQLDPVNPVSLLAKVHLAVGRVNDSLEDLNAITDQTRTILDLNLDRIDKAMSNFKEGSDHLRAGLKEIRLNPWRLLYTPTPSEAKQESILSAARDFSEAARQLDDAVVRLKALAESRRSQIPADDQQLIEVRAMLADTFNKFSEAEKALWRELDVE